MKNNILYRKALIELKIEELRLKNFKVFKDIRITNLPDMAVFLGANGTGKSTLFDVFGFLHDSLRYNVKAALLKRGGYKEVVSRNGKGPIEIEIKFRAELEETLVTYELHIGLNERNLPIVSRELLKYVRGKNSESWNLLNFFNGSGTVIVNESEYGLEGVKEQREEHKLDSPDILAIKGLGQFRKYKQVATLRRLIEGWHVSDFQVQEARASQDVGYAEHLSQTGENLPFVAQFMHEHYPRKFQEVLRKMEQRVPGVTSVEAAETLDRRIILRFQDGAFRDPFIARYVSDGSLKMFAYLLLLSNSNPHPLLCIKEPENHLYPDLLNELAEEFRSHCEKGGQVFISTHSPGFVNGAQLEELFWLVKVDGFSQIKRASDDELLRHLVAEGDLPGYLWDQGLFKGASFNK